MRTDRINCTRLNDDENERVFKTCFKISFNIWGCHFLVQCQWHSVRFGVCLIILLYSSFFLVGTTFGYLKVYFRFNESRKSALTIQIKNIHTFDQLQSKFNFLSFFFLIFHSFLFWRWRAMKGFRCILNK